MERRSESGPSPGTRDGSFTAALRLPFGDPVLSSAGRGMAIETPGLDVPPVRASYGCRAGAVCGLALQGRPDWPRYRSLGARTYGPSDRAVQARVAIIRVQK